MLEDIIEERETERGDDDDDDEEEEVASLVGGKQNKGNNNGGNKTNDRFKKEFVDFVKKAPPNYQLSQCFLSYNATTDAIYDCLVRNNKSFTSEMKTKLESLKKASGSSQHTTEKEDSELKRQQNALVPYLKNWVMANEIEKTMTQGAWSTSHDDLYCKAMLAKTHIDEDKADFNDLNSILSDYRNNVIGAWLEKIYLEIKVYVFDPIREIDSFLHRNSHNIYRFKRNLAKVSSYFKENPSIKSSIEAARIEDWINKIIAKLKENTKLDRTDASSLREYERDVLNAPKKLTVAYNNLVEVLAKEKIEHDKKRRDIDALKNARASDDTVEVFRLLREATILFENHSFIESKKTFLAPGEPTPSDDGNYVRVVDIDEVPDEGVMERLRLLLVLVGQLDDFDKKYIYNSTVTYDDPLINEFVGRVDGRGELADCFNVEEVK